MKTIVNNNINTVEVALYNIPITPFTLEYCKENFTIFFKIEDFAVNICEFVQNFVSFYVPRGVHIMNLAKS